MNIKKEINTIKLCGTIVSPFTYSHETCGKHFYLVYVKVQRFSKMYDTIPLIVSKELIDISCNLSDVRVFVSGNVRSYNIHEEKRSRLLLCVFVKRFEIISEDNLICNSNQVSFDGFICKKPIYRKTPFGREVADVLLAINRPFGKTDYIPCILWGRNARYARNFNIGERYIMHGRFQSREYVKKLENDRSETRVAYEISVSKVRIPFDENKLLEINRIMDPKTIVYDYLFNYFGGDTFKGKKITGAGIQLAIRAYKNGKEVKLTEEPKYNKNFFCDIFKISFDKEKLFVVEKNLRVDNLFRMFNGFEKIEPEVVGYYFDYLSSLSEDHFCAESMVVSEEDFRVFLKNHIADFDICDNINAQVPSMSFI